MSQFVSQFESKTPPPSSPFAFSLKDLQEVLKEFTLDIIEEIRNAKRIIISDLLEKDKIRREDICSAARGVNLKMDETTENEERLDFNMEEPVNIEFAQEEATISQNECIGGLEEEKLQVYSKKFFIKDTSFNLEWKLEEVGEIEAKDFSILMDETTENEEILDFNMEELVNIKATQEELTILQKECIGGLEEEKLQVFAKKFIIKDTSSNLEWKSEVGNEIENFLKETSLKASRRRKDFAFLFDLWKCQVSRGDTVTGTAANYDGLCRRLNTVL